jgi:hypothetical protein
MLLNGYAGYSTSDTRPQIAEGAGSQELITNWFVVRVETRTRCLVVKEPA